jgi:hypothetical protein
MINAAFGCSYPNVVAASFDEFSGPFQSWFKRLTGNNADASDVRSAYAGVLDALRERKPPFSPDDVVQEFVALLKSYGLRER